MGEISVEVGEQLDNRSNEIMSAISPSLFLDKSPLSFEYQKSKTSRETNTNTILHGNFTTVFKITRPRPTILKCQFHVAVN